MAKATKTKVVAAKPGSGKKKGKGTPVQPAKVASRAVIDPELFARAENTLQEIADKLSIDLDKVAKLSPNDYMALDLNRTSSVFSLTRRESIVAIHKAMKSSDAGLQGKFVGSHLLVSNSCKKGNSYQVSYYRSKPAGNRIDELMFRVFRDEAGLSSAKQHKVRIIRICGVVGCVNPVHLELEKLSEAASRKTCQENLLEECIHKPPQVECVREPVEAEAVIWPAKLRKTKRVKTTVNAVTETPKLDVIWPEDLAGALQDKDSLVILTPTKLRKSVVESEQEVVSSEVLETPPLKRRKDGKSKPRSSGGSEKSSGGKAFYIQYIVVWFLY